MDLLQAKFEDYKKIVNYQLVYEFQNGDKVDFRLKQTDFPHLLGLHKLKDIPIIGKFNDTTDKTVSAKYLISKIKKGTLLTDGIVRGSRYFRDIEMRYTNFSKERLLTMSYTDAIINFDASKIGSSLNAKYILFESFNQGYNHFCIAEDENLRYYAESFFCSLDDRYLRNQKIVKIDRIQIYDDKGQLYLQDEFRY